MMYFREKLVMDISFPEKETLVFYDSLVYTIVNDQIVNQSSLFDNFISSSVYHLILNNKTAKLWFGRQSVLSKS